MKKTKIITTLGPACDTDEMLEKLILSGSDCARLNFSHGTHAEQLVRIERIRRVREKLNLPYPILLDTKGPEIRVRLFENGKIEFEVLPFTFHGLFMIVLFLIGRTFILNKKEKQIVNEEISVQDSVVIESEVIDNE
jgi:pyruvate kinase